VRNRRDGSVEALFSGPEDVVSNMVASCRRGRHRRAWTLSRKNPVIPMR